MICDLVIGGYCLSEKLPDLLLFFSFWLRRLIGWLIYLNSIYFGIELKADSNEFNL